jgi:hypothetical protein
MNYKIIGSTASFAVLGLALVILCFSVGQSGEVHAMNIAVLVFGASSGWLAGILLSPYDPKGRVTSPDMQLLCQLSRPAILSRRWIECWRKYSSPSSYFRPCLASDF